MANECLLISIFSPITNSIQTYEFITFVKILVNDPSECKYK